MKIKSLLTFLIVGLFVVSLAGCSGQSASTSKTSNSDAQEEQVEKVSKDDVIALEGKTLTEGIALLKDSNYEYKIVNSGNLYDFTEEAKSWSQENTDGWVITDVDTSGIVNKKCTLTIKTKEAVDAENKEKNLEAKLSFDAAADAILEKGKQEYPYGFKLNYIGGEGAENSKSVADENTWLITYRCEITNVFGATQTAKCEAKVTGTTDSPQVTEFKVY